MEYSKQTVIDGLKHSIEITEQEIEKYSKLYDKQVAQGRTAHREFLKKRLNKMKMQLKELEDDGRFKEKS
ncbi:hypothetical protein [Streptococcus sp. KHUD_018]